jgi:hypothetical protein
MTCSGLVEVVGDGEAVPDCSAANMVLRRWTGFCFHPHRRPDRRSDHFRFAHPGEVHPTDPIGEA